MPKILRIINRFNIGGPTYNATFLSRFLDDEYETLLIGGLPEKDEADSLHILEEYGLSPLLIEEMQRVPSFQSDKAAYRKIKQIIEEFKPDIVHTHAAKAGALGRKAAKSCGVPVIVHTFHGHVFHSYFGKVKTNIFKFIERRLARKSDGIIAISEIQKHELSKIHKICTEDKIKVIPLGFDLDKFQNETSKREFVREKYGIEEGEIAIAIVGRLAPIKNHSLFLSIIEEVLTKTSKKVKVFIVGDGSKRVSIEEKVEFLNAKFGNVLLMTSWIKNIGEFNAGMDIMCLTSDNEGTPVSLIEAQAGNLAVISTDVGGVRDIIKDGETGYIVPKNNVNLFSEKLLFLIEDDETRNRFSKNGWDFVKEKFHYKTLVNNVNAYYKVLLEKKKIKI